MIWLAIGAGGAIGSMARWGVVTLFERVAPAFVVPYATFAVNVIGCLVIGVLAGLAASGRIEWTPVTRGFVFAGILGGFTTFSSFGLDTVMLNEAGLTGTAAWNVAGQVVLGLLAVSAGFALGRG